MPFKIIGNDIIAYATGGALESVWTPPDRDDMESIMLLNSPAEVAAAYIIEVIQLLTDPDVKEEWPLYVGHMVDGNNVEDNAASIKDSPGSLDGKSLRSGEVSQHFGLQLKIRCVDYAEGWKKIENVAVELDGVDSGATIEVNGTTYEIENFSRTSPVVPLGQEEKGKKRDRFVVNYKLAIRELV